MALPNNNAGRAQSRGGDTPKRHLSRTASSVGELQGVNQLEARVKDAVIVALNNVPEGEVVDYEKLGDNIRTLMSDAFERIDRAVSDAALSERFEVASRVELLVAREISLARIAEITEQIRILEREVDLEVQRARATDAPWREIAAAAGITHPTAIRRWGDAERSGA